MDLRKLKTLIDLVSESGISELEITEGDGKVRIVKNAPVVMAAPAAPVMTMPMPITPSTISGAPAVAGVAPAPAPAPEAPSGHWCVRGWHFYRSRRRARALCFGGSAVAEGETLCIIEG